MQSNAAEIWALEHSSHSPIHYYTCGNCAVLRSHGGRNFSENQDLWNSKFADVWCDASLGGSASNVRGPIHDCSKQSGVHAVSLLPYTCALCVSKSRLPNTANANVPSNGPIVKKMRVGICNAFFRERGSDLRTREEPLQTLSLRTRQLGHVNVSCILHDGYQLYIPTLWHQQFETFTLRRSIVLLPMSMKTPCEGNKPHVLTTSLILSLSTINPYATTIFMPNCNSYYWCATCEKR